MRSLSVLIAGVGGQGTLLTSQVLGAAAMKAGYDVKMSEVHGMAQRGGSVVTYVRIGKNVDSPVIEKGGADILLCFEKLEALRWIDYAKKDGTIIVNDQRIDPMPVIIGSVEYPEGIIEKLSASFPRVIPVKALDAARQLGNIKVLNIIMLGIMAKNTDIPVETWHEAISETVKQRFAELNIKAFDKGYKMAF